MRRKQQRKAAAAAALDKLSWKKVDTPASFLEGCAQAGFVELEEIDVDPSLVRTLKESPAAVESDSEPEFDEEPTAAPSDSDSDAAPQKRQKKKKQQQKKKPQQQRPTKKPEAAAEAAAEEPTEEDDKKDAEWKGFRLHPEALAGIRRLGFACPTPVQRAAIPAVSIAGKDVIGAAPTGSGKTLAYAVPMVSRLLELRDEEAGHQQSEGEKKMRALVLTPTRELALQVRDHIVAFAGTSVRVVAVVGGMSAAKQERLLGLGPEIVVATTGRLWELISDQGNTFLGDFSRLAFFVLDEADRMVEVGHFRELDAIATMIRRVHNVDLAGEKQQSPEDEEELDGYQVVGGEEEEEEEEGEEQRAVSLKQEKLHTLVFSATLAVTQATVDGNKFNRPKKKKKAGDAPTPLDRVLEKVVFQRPTEVVDLTSKNVTVSTLTEFKLLCTEEDKDVHLMSFLLARKPGRVLVFANSIASVRHVLQILKRMRICACSVHGVLQQRQRIRSLEHFKSHDSCVLVASDVAARGLDIPGVEYVIHYHIPRTSDLYVHRSGRTARAGLSGTSIALVGPAEAATFSEICKKLGKDIAVLPAPTAATWGAANKKAPDMSTLRHAVAVARALNREIQLAAIDALKKRWLISKAKQLDVEVDEEIALEFGAPGAEVEAAEEDAHAEAGDEDADGVEKEELMDARQRAQEEWERRVSSLKLKLAKLLFELEDAEKAVMPVGFGKRAIPIGSGLVASQLDEQIAKARERRRQLEKIRAQAPFKAGKTAVLASEHVRDRKKLSSALVAKMHKKAKKSKKQVKRNKHKRR